MDKNPDQPQWVKDVGLLAVVVTEVVGLTFLGIAVGYWFWAKKGAPWWVLLLCAASGLTVAIVRIARYFRVR